jgi:hypothetical protein
VYLWASSILFIVDPAVRLILAAPGVAARAQRLWAVLFAAATVVVAEALIVALAAASPQPWGWDRADAGALPVVLSAAVGAGYAFVSTLVFLRMHDEAALGEARAAEAAVDEDTLHHLPEAPADADPGSVAVGEVYSASNTAPLDSPAFAPATVMDRVVPRLIRTDGYAEDPCAEHEPRPAEDPTPDTVAVTVDISKPAPAPGSARTLVSVLADFTAASGPVRGALYSLSGLAIQLGATVGAVASFVAVVVCGAIADPSFR